MMTNQRDLLPMKAMYFFFNAAQACYFNYFAAVGQHAGLSIAFTGTIMAVAPILGAICKASTGVIADKTRNISAILIICEVLVMIFGWGLLTTPLLSNHRVEGINQTYSQCPAQINVSELPSWSPATDCFLHCKGQPISILGINKSSTNCSSSCDLNCTSMITDIGLPATVLYAISVMVTFALGSTLYSITDAACYEVLGPDRGHLFGQQRLWGTLSWGLTSPLIGLIMDTLPSFSPYKYFPAAIGLTIYLALNIGLILYIPNFPTPQSSDNFLRDLQLIYRDIRVIVFTLWSFIGGILIAVMWTYAVPLLGSLNAPNVLIGLTFSMQSLVIEIPMFFVSGYILKRIGHFGCMAAAFVCLGLKLLGYSVLRNPWLALIMDVSGGAVFPLFYAALTGFASISALEGTAGTMQCLFGAIYEGLGISLGNYVCGYFIEWFGIRKTFRIFGVIALICAPLCALSKFVGRLKQRDYSNAQTEKSSDIPSCIGC